MDLRSVSMASWLVLANSDSPLTAISWSFTRSRPSCWWPRKHIGGGGGGEERERKRSKRKEKLDCMEKGGERRKRAEGRRRRKEKESRERASDKSKGTLHLDGGEEEGDDFREAEFWD
ncbi:hypothetical protein EYF80_061327 [Liparis tanakae]|uniref:Uncharacterized protein n=1 Tax=Liparis tanakae TaxID=230148 RepID=A0A4Z2EID6_9TELE|nr:hypothetical protein EYF80_061327 [Liparis tanakae]